MVAKAIGVGSGQWWNLRDETSAVKRLHGTEHADARRHRRPRCAAARAEDSWSQLAQLVAGRKRVGTTKRS